MEEVLTPIQWFPSIFAMSPFDSKAATFKFKCFFYFRLGLILAVIMGGILYRMSFTTIHNANQGVIVSSVVFAQYIFRMSTTVCCLLAFRPPLIWAFCKTNSELDEKFKALGQGVHYKDGRKLSQQLAVFVVAKVVLQQIPYVAKGLNWDLTTFIDYLNCNVPLLLIHSVLLQWTVYMNILKAHFVDLNSILKTVKYRQCWVVDDLDSSSKKPKKSITNIEIVRRSAEIYDKLCEQAAYLNRAFGRQMLCIIPTVFILIIYNSFRVCQMIKNNKIDFEAETVVFDLLYFVSLMEMVIPCVLVKQGGDRFVDVLHEIDVDGCPDYDSIILQTHHQKIEFSACGVFPLDGTLVYTISGALTTYLVILLQFDL